MKHDGIPPVEPLAPIVDQMREIAREALPDPQTCRVVLFDDGTVDAHLYHRGPGDEKECIRYVYPTSEIIWEYSKGGSWRKEELSGGETLEIPVLDEVDVKKIASVQPPYH